jgi:Acyl-coenzyme A:6-aminopenicillanic acid acyl-transferase
MQLNMTKPAGHKRLATWMRRLVYGVLLLVVLGAGVLSFLIWYKPSPFQITLAGKSGDLGAGYGRKLRTPMRLLTRYYLDRKVCQGDAKLIETSRESALQSLANWPKEYREELDATAAAAQLPVSALAFGNSFVDLGRVRAGCRSVVLSETNLLFHAHNLDWDTLGGLGRWTTCIVRRNPTDGRLATVSIGFPGMIGALDVINEKGLALSFNQLGWGKGGTNEPVFVMVRRIAETCTSLEDARTNLIHAPPGMAFIITVSDARSASGSVFERVNNRVTERPLQRGFVAACNTVQGTNFGTTRLDQVLTKSGANDLSAVQRVLAAPEVLMECNIYSVIFDFRHNRFWLASGEIPAAKSGYQEFQLFK